MSAARSVEFHPLAEIEALDAQAWYDERSEVAAQRFVFAFEQTISKIVVGPKGYRASRRKPTGCTYR